MRTPNKSRGHKNAKPVSGHLLKVAVLALVSPSLLAATIVKNNNNDALNLGSSWVGGTTPGAADTAQWDATLTAPANCTNVLGGNLNWAGIKIVAPAAPVEIDGANTLTLTNLDMSAAVVDLTLNCGLDVEGAPTWLIASGRTLNLGSAMTGAGNIKQQGGTVRLAPGTGALPSAMTYSFAGATALDLGGNSQTLNSMIPPWSATNQVSHGDLALTLAGADYDPKTQGNNSAEDLTGLSSFTVNNSSRSFSFNCGDTGAGGASIYLYLAASNLVAVNNFNIGNNGYVASGASPNPVLCLGQTNFINANNFNVTGYRSSGTVKFQSGLSNPLLKLRAPNGTSRLPNWTIGKYTSGSMSGFGTVDLTGGTLNCVVGNLVVGEQSPSAGSSATGTLVIDGADSYLEVQTAANLAKKDASTGTPTVTGTITQRAGTVKMASLVMGNNLGTSAGVTIKAGYQMGDGLLRVQSLTGGTVGASENASSFRTLFWTNGVIQNFDAANGLTAQGPLVISAAGSGNRYLRTDASVQNTIACALKQTAGASPIVADGAGTLDLQGSDDNAYLGLSVSNGIVSLDKASSSTVHAVGSSLSLNGGSVYLAGNGGSGGDQIYDGCVVVLNSGSFDLYGQTETIAGLSGTGGVLADSVGGGNLTLNVPNGTNYISSATLNQGGLTIGLAVGGGSGTQILTGSDNRTSEATTINSGTLQIGNGGSGNLAGGSVVVNSPGRLVYDQSGMSAFTGSFSGNGDVVLNGTGTVVLGNDSHTGQTLVNAGTLQAASGATSVGGSLIRVSAGATLDLSPGSPVALTAQQLTGAGTVNGSFFLGSGALLSGTLTITGGDVSTGDTSTNAPGGFGQAGTITVNGNYNCGYNSYLVYDLAAATTAGSGVNDLISISGNLDLSQPCTLIVKGTPQTGTYTLATFGSFTGSAANLTVIGSPRITFSPRVSGNSLLLDVTGSAASLAWQGDGSANAWDNSLLAVWLNLGTSAADVFYPADNVVFNDSSANPTVNINDTVLPGSVLVNATQNYTFAGAGDISGNIALTKTNTGTLTIQNNNSFTGPVNVNGGAVSVASVAPGGAQPLGAGTALNLNGGAFQYTGPAVGLGGFNRDLTLGANGGTIDQESSAGIYFFLTNRIAGGGSLTKAGAQQLILGDAATGAGSNTYSGGTYINAGNLQIRNAAALGTNSVWINPGGSLSEDGGFAGAIANNIFLQGGNLGGGPANYTFNGTVNITTNSTVGFSALTLAGPVTGTSALNVNAGTVTLLNNNNNYAGGTFINTNATLQLGTNGPNGWLAAPPVDQPLTNNGALVFNSSLTNVVGFSITGTGNVTQNGVGYTVLTGTNTFSGTLAVNGTTAGGGIVLSNSQAAGTGLINIAGVNNRSTLQLVGGITVTNNLLVSQRPNGSTVPHIANVAGTNTLAGLTTLTSGGNLWMLSADAGQMIVAGISNSVGGFNRVLYLQGAANGVVSNLIDASQAWLQLIKSGAGTWTLAGPASIGAGIQVSQGTLIVNGNVDSGTAAGNATVNGGNLIVNGTLPGTVTVSNTAALGGAGIITNAVTVQAGGTLAPGLASAASTATLKLNSDLTLAGNAWFKLNKALGQSNDFVVVNGALSNTGSANVLTVSNAGPALVAGDKFTLFSQPMASGGSLTVTGGGSGVTWANNLAVDGSITVLTAPPAVNTNSFAVGAVVSGNNLNLSWPPDRLGWMVQIQTNQLNAGLGTNWVTLTNSAAGTNYSLPISPANPSVFIRMTYP